ncbi:MAG: YciI-like protein [Pseudomonadota bacterium]
MLFALICTDKPESFDLRASVRPEHLDFLSGLGERLKAGGPFLDSESRPCGSLVVIEAADMAEAEAVAASDPYAKAGLFENVDIRAWNWVLKNPEG